MQVKNVWLPVCLVEGFCQMLNKGFNFCVRLAQLIWIGRNDTCVSLRRAVIGAPTHFSALPLCDWIGPSLLTSLHLEKFIIQFYQVRWEMWCELRLATAIKFFKTLQFPRKAQKGQSLRTKQKHAN